APHPRQLTYEPGLRPGQRQADPRLGEEREVAARRGRRGLEAEEPDLPCERDGRGEGGLRARAPDLPPYPGRDPPMKNATDIARELVGHMTLAEKVSQLVNASPAIERLGVPAHDWWNECLHGVARAGTATVFPQAIGLAASFDPDLVHRVAFAISDEARAKHHE